MRTFFFVSLLTLCLAPLSRAATIVVPTDEPTIQAGVDAALPGDTVEIACGTYFEWRILVDKAIVIRSQTGDPSCVTIDATELDEVFEIAHTGGEVELEGLTIQNGRGASGAGVDLFHAPATIRRCVFQGNATDDVPNRGGAIQALYSPLVVEDSVFRENFSVSGTIVQEVGSPTSLTRCLFDSNGFFNGSEANTGVIENLGDSPLVISNCTMVANGARSQVIFALTTAPQLDHTIIAGNAGFPVRCSGVPSVECCDLFGNALGDWVDCVEPLEGMNGNFSADPRFCDPENGEFTLMSDSPCAPPGVTGCGLVGALPVGCGPISIEVEGWAGIKAMYR